MKKRKIIILIFIISAGLSIGLGMLDHETESFIHLLTGDPGNIPTLILFTLGFASLGVMVWGMILLLWQLFKSYQT